MKIATKVFLPPDTIRKLDLLSERSGRGKSEIARAAIESYLSPDSAEAAEAALTRRIDRLARQLDRIERDVTIVTEAVALHVKTWLKITPVMSSAGIGQRHQKDRNATRRLSSSWLSALRTGDC